jgi:hypothetical protein
MAFKHGGSAWSIYYDTLTLPDGKVTAGFYCNGVNRSIGNDALGQACLVENKPRTVDGRSIYEWQSAGGGYITNDQRNAKRISDKVEATLKKFNLSNALLYYDKLRHEFYCVDGRTAVVQNTANNAWYVYTDFDAKCLINYKDEFYYGDSIGMLNHVSESYTADHLQPIDCYWESGSLSFGKDWLEKYSPEIWVGLAQEENASCNVGIIADNHPLIYESVDAPAGQNLPAMIRRRLKGQKFTFYKLVFLSNSTDTTATVAAVDIKVKYNIPVK